MVRRHHSFCSPDGQVRTSPAAAGRVALDVEKKEKKEEKKGRKREEGDRERRRDTGRRSQTQKKSKALQT